MNIERWMAGRRQSWQNLEELINTINKSGIVSLSKDQLQALGKLYRCTSSDLSRARTLNLGSDVTGYLNSLVVQAHNQVYHRQQHRLQDFFHFIWITVPRVIREYFPYVILAFFLYTIPAAGSWYAAMKDPSFMELELQKGEPIISEEMRHSIEKHELWTDSAQQRSPAFTGMITTNNIKVSIFSFAAGIIFGFGAAWILIVNGIMLGTVFAACQQHGMHKALAAFIVGHGVLELTAIFISGGAGLLIGKALLFPGNYPRVDSLRLHLRPAFVMFAGCIPMLIFAGLIEGFISPRTDITANMKALIGLSSFSLLLLYLLLPRTDQISKN